MCYINLLIKKNKYTLIFFVLATSFLTTQVTAKFTSVEGYDDGLLSNNANWGGQYFYINTASEKVSTQSNTADAFLGQAQSILLDETITFEVDRRYGGILLHSL